MAARRSYVFFLGALFVIATGLAFLKITANPHIAGLGPTVALACECLTAFSVAEQAKF